MFLYVNRQLRHQTVRKNWNLTTRVCREFPIVYWHLPRLKKFIWIKIYSPQLPAILAFFAGTKKKNTINLNLFYRQKYN